MRFRDIPQFTKAARYGVDVDWHYLENHLTGWAEYPNGIDLDPDFQRAHVWSEGQQRAYVEHVLRGGWASRQILFNCIGWNTLSECGPIVLVDGKQRLEAVRKFLRNELSIFEGYKRNDFTDRLNPLTASFRICVNDLPSREAVLKWYLELNTGGTPHSDTDIDKVQQMLEAEMQANRLKFIDSCCKV
jgi:hypothetical protein